MWLTRVFHRSICSLPFLAVDALSGSVLALAQATKTSRTLVSWTTCMNNDKKIIAPGPFPFLSANSDVFSCLHLSKRHMAKGKDRKKEKKTDKPKVVLDDEDMEKMIAYEDFKLEVESIIDDLKND